MTTTRKGSKGSRSWGLGKGRRTSASLVEAGDTAPTLTLAGIERFTVGEAIGAAQEAELAAVQSFGSEASYGLAAILEGGAEVIPINTRCCGVTTRSRSSSCRLSC